jgi:hypothetical protein
VPPSSGQSSIPLNPGGSREWIDFVPRYEVLLTFIDVLYSAVLGYGLFLAGEVLREYFQSHHFDWAKFGLLGFSIFYLIGDYVDSRIFTAQYPYTCLRRFFIDVTIAIVFFVSFVAANVSSPLFLIVIASAFLLGSYWCWALDFEVKGVQPLKYAPVLIASHALTASLYLRFWWNRRHEYQMAARDAGWVWILYLSWALAYFLIEVFILMPSKEADLFPNFPLGRLLRDRRTTMKVRNAVVRAVRPAVRKFFTMVRYIENFWDRIDR